MSEKYSTNATKSRLEQMTREFLDAINCRKFTTDSVAFKHIAPTFTFQRDHQLHDLEAMLQSKFYLAGIFPKFEIQIRDMSTSIDESLGVATVYANIVWTNMFPAGGCLAMPSICVTEFQQLLGGEWLMVKHSCALGHDFAGEI